MFMLLFFTPVTWVAILECVLMGGFTAAIGFNVMHDGGHGSFSKSKFWNKIAAFSVNALGASGIMWNNKHNIIHHTYTNIDGIDDDIEIKPLLRMCSYAKEIFDTPLSAYLCLVLIHLVITGLGISIRLQKVFQAKKLEMFPLKK